MAPTRREAAAAFSALAAVSLALPGCRLSPPSRGPQEDPAACGTVAGVRFTDATASAGIRFRHTHGGSGQKYLPETMGAGCAFLDFDQDDWLDVLLLNGRPLGERDGTGAPPPAGGPTPALYR